MKDGTIIGVVFLIYLAISLPIIAEHYTEKQPEIKPHVCVTAKQHILYYERYEMFLNQGKKDSVAKYAALLKF